jgi:iron complex outermembrane receptor protein
MDQKYVLPAQIMKVKPIVLAVLTTLTVTPAWAADADTAGQQQVQQLDAVTVTATRREEPLQKVPVAVTVLKGEQLERANVNSAETLANQVPTLIFRKGNTNKDSALNLRGIGTISFSSGTEPAVSTVIDGVVYARSGQSTLEFLDVDRIEVLRGPQGTLFGKNASAGVINITTKAPTKEFTGYIDTSYYQGNESRVRAGVSGPLSDKVRVSFDGLYGNYDGNGTNVYNGEKINGYEHNGIRGKIEATPTSDLKLTLIGDYLASNDNGTADVIGSVSSTTYNNLLFSPALSPVSVGSENRDINNNVSPYTRDVSQGVSLQADLKLDRYTLTSITAYRGWDNTQHRDGDFTSSFPAYVNTGTASGNVSSSDVGDLGFSQYSQEFRLAAPKGGLFEYVTGAYFSTTKETDAFNRLVTACSASTLSTNASTGLTPCAVGSSTYVSQNGDAHWTTRLTNYALFGENTFNFTDSFRGIAGLRWTHDQVKYDFNRTSTSATAFTGVYPGFSSTGETSHDGYSGRLGVQYDLNPNVTGYFTYSRGYKGPAFNVFFNMVSTDTGAIAPEKSNAYELGLKTTSFNKKLTLNAAAFYASYDNFQATTYDSVGGQIVSRLTNAGEVSTRGLEADFNLKPLSQWGISGGVAYTDAHIDHFNCPASVASTCAALDGKTLPYSPKWKSVTRTDYTIPLRQTRFDLELATSFTWQSKVQYDINQSQDTIQGAYGLWDASVSLVDSSDKLRISLIGKNLTDKYYAISKINAGTYIRQIAPRDSERYFGINIRKEF